MMTKNFGVYIIVLMLMSIFFSGLYSCSSVKADKHHDSSSQLPEDDQQAKKCQIICKEWGEECFIRQQGNNQQRKCHHVCKRTGEECY